MSEDTNSDGKLIVDAKGTVRSVPTSELKSPLLSNANSSVTPGKWVDGEISDELAHSMKNADTNKGTGMSLNDLLGDQLKTDK